MQHTHAGRRGSRMTDQRRSSHDDLVEALETNGFPVLAAAVARRLQQLSVGGPAGQVPPPRSASSRSPDTTSSD